jgi:DUF1680 family protein
MHLTHRIAIALAVLIGSAAAALAQDAPRNVALAAKASTSYVSDHETLSAINDGFEPRNQGDHTRGAYGNWPRSGSQWVEYEWPLPISTNKIDVYWWADGQGVHLPTASRLKYWDGNAYIDVPGASGLGVAGPGYNTTTFNEITTTKLRLEFDSEGANSTGIIEWKVYDSGKSPKFPPAVRAGPDRTVVYPGKTYLNGATLGPASKLRWDVEAGHGSVTFSDSTAASSTATFSAPGDYVLKLTASEGDLSSSSSLKVKVVNPPEQAPLNVVYTTHYTIDNPLWNSRVKSLIVHWIPHCIDQINRTDIPRGRGDGGIDNFIEAAKALRGEPHAAHKGYVFSNAWVHQTVESMCIALMVDPKGDNEMIAAQEKFRATLEDWIPKILAAQEPDGYLQTAYTLADRNRWPAHWSPRQRGNHEGYTAGYFIESAINHYTMTGGKDLRLYNAAKKLADCWYDNIGPAPKKPWFDGHQEMEQALVRFGRFVNDMEGNGKGDHYIELAKFLLDCRGGGQQYDQSHLPVVQQYEAVGHAVRAVYNYSGMADVATETGDPDYRSAVMSLWDNIVNRKYYVTGGIGSGETSEGFGGDYSLRNNAYCESCSTCGLIFFQYKMNLAYHDAKYADLYEESLYNALLGATNIDGTTFNYTNPLIGGNRTEWNVCPCCVGNIPRTLLMLPTWMYMKGSDGIYVNLFVGSTVNINKVAGTDVQLVQKTDYPWSGNVAITVNPAASKQFVMRIRVPHRSVSELYSSTPEADGITSMSVNGSPLQPTIENGYAVIAREWKAGDKIEFVLPMTPQRVKADERIAADRGRVALRYGPLVYNIESVDQNVDSVLKSDAPLTAEFRSDLLGGVMTLKSTFADGSAMLAVPHYARLNRGGRSQVWRRDE